MSKTKSTVEDITSKTGRLILAAAAILILNGVIVGAVLMMAGNNTTARVQIKNEADANRQATKANTELINYLETNNQAITLLKDTLPNELTILDFIQVLENTIRQYDPEGSMKFSSTNPVKVGNELAIPLMITMNATPTELVDFLRHFERMPYLLELLSLHSELPQGVGSKGRVTLGVRLYVQDPFIN